MNSESNNIEFETSDPVNENGKKKKAQIEKRKLPLWCKILYALALFCGLLYFLFVKFPAFSDFFNKYISPVVRGFLSKSTDWIPFSLAECALICLPLILVAVIAYGCKRYSGSWRNVGVFCLIILSVGAYVFSTFTLGFVPAYRGSTLDVKMGLEKSEVSAEELRDTALILSNQLNADVTSVYFTSEGSSVMPYSYTELNDKLMDAYDKACEKYDFIQNIDSNIKRVLLSEPMTYTHISGVYTFFTGEANLNINYPDFNLPYTAAHEFAHQRGIAREDEANFVAFLVCMESDDAYIRYSAYLNLYEYVSDALYSANHEYYFSVDATLPNDVKRELIAYSKFFNKYRDSVASDISGAVNDIYLNSNGVEAGSKSYGMVVDLAVAYYKKAN